MEDRQINIDLTRKQAVEFLVSCGFDRKKVLRQNDDNLAVAYDIAKRREREFKARLEEVQ